jgi:hypothetical protein
MGIFRFPDKGIIFFCRVFVEKYQNDQAGT